MAAGNRPEVDPASERRIVDRDLDGPAAPAGPAPRRPRRSGYEGHQRLIANPFLAIVGLIAWFATVRQTVQSRRLDLFIPALASLGLILFLFQYHCLDCGATGRLTGWRRHVCDRIQRRSESGAAPRAHVLSPFAQTVLCFYVLILGLIVWWIVAP